MPEEQPLSEGISEEDAILQHVPRSPILWSKKAADNSIRVEHHRYPAWGTNECCLPDYTISVHVRHPIRLRQAANGRRMQEYMGYGDIIVSPPHLHRELRWDKQAELVLLYLEPRVFASAVEEVVDAERIEIVPQFKLCDPLIQHILLALKTELTSEELSNQLYAESMAIALSVHLLKKYSAFTPRLPDYSRGLPPSKLQRAIEYINDNLDKELKLNLIAKEVRMSQYYFASLFKQSMGIAPYQYVMQQRVERAKQLLKRGEIVIADIAIQCGFANQSHFTKYFRQVTGITPKAYRDGL